MSHLTQHPRDVAGSLTEAVSGVYLAPPFNRRKERFKSLTTEALRQTGEAFEPELLKDFVETLRQAKEAG